MHCSVTIIPVVVADLHSSIEYLRTFMFKHSTKLSVSYTISVYHYPLRQAIVNLMPLSQSSYNISDRFYTVVQN